MCGFTGMLVPGGFPGSEGEDLLGRMTDVLVHRGPDDRGLWLDSERGVGLGFRRLAILDLTPEGHQPMASASGRYVITFNGEIYNFAALRTELEALGHGFRGHSDTEIILAGFEEWGFRDAVARFWGMFAMAVWDRKERRLRLVRDRLGKKPLYYGWQNGTFLFGSELKALRVHPAFQGRIDREALTLYLRYNCIPGEYSIYQGIKKLQPGCTLEIDLERPGEMGSPEPYWDLRAIAERGEASPFAGTEDEALEQLELLLKDAVSLRKVADVPVGAFLSGGVDSSLVVALMQSGGGFSARTFSIGYEEDNYNEAPHARAVADHLGTQHTEFYVSAGDAQSVIPSLPTLFDEPFADSSQIPTFLVSKLARKEVTVALTGDGGDEVFGGYNRHHLGSSILRNTGWMPSVLRSAGARAVLSVSPAAWDALMHRVNPMLPARHRRLVTGEKLHKLADLMGFHNLEDFYVKAVSHWRRPASLVIGGHEPVLNATDPASWAQLREPAHRMMFLDMMSYLVDDILVKVDRASMGVSLESRAPLLDHRVIEFAWSLPLSMKIKGREGKWILRRLLDKYVPKFLIDRPKQGFGVPIGDWLRGHIRPWAESLLEASRLQREGFLDPAPIRRAWEEHLSGKRNHQHHLWDVLMFQAWLEAQG